MHRDRDSFIDDVYEVYGAVFRKRDETYPRQNRAIGRCLADDRPSTVGYEDTNYKSRERL